MLNMNKQWHILCNLTNFHGAWVPTCFDSGYVDSFGVILYVGRFGWSIDVGHCSFWGGSTWNVTVRITGWADHWGARGITEVIGRSPGLYVWKWPWRWIIGWGERRTDCDRSTSLAAMNRLIMRVRFHNKVATEKINIQITQKLQLHVHNWKQ